MYENETYDKILARMLGRVPGELDKRPSSIIYDTHSSTAVELQNLYLELEYLIKNSYGDTAAREYLVLLGRDRGLSPEAASAAILKGVFTPDSVNVSGKRFNIREMNYTVLEPLEPGAYKVRCESTGAIGNQYLGQMIPMEYIPGLETATLTEVLIPGEDDEDTESFRKRYFDSFKAQAFGGNQADYLEKVRSIEGVGDVKVTRIWNGDINPSELIPGEAVTAWYNSILSTLPPQVAAWLTAVYTAAVNKKLTVGGTVLVTVVNSMDYGVASEVLLDKIQTELDPVQNAGEGVGLAPIGHVVNVKSAESVTINVITDVTFDAGYSWLNSKDAIESAIKEYLLELRKKWSDSTNTVVRISQIETRILGVKGVLDVSNTKINGTMENLVLSKYQIPILGGASE